MLADLNFINTLRSFDKDSINEKSIQAITKIFEENHTLTVENVSKIATALVPFLLWVKGIHQYSLILLKIKKEKASPEKKVEKIVEKIVERVV